MLFNKSFKITLISAGLLALTACATTSGSNDGSNGSGSFANGDNASASGLGSETSFGGSSNKMQVGNQSYYYDFDKNDVRSDDVPSIKVQADYLATHSNSKVLLAGNTDERGSREYNIALGERRAMSVATILQANGVNKSQITTVSYGAEKPVAVGHSEEDYQKNRRTDLTYQTPIGK
jgi:peptidoglycan-associated lipoprotein